MEGARRGFWPMSKGFRRRWDIGIGKRRFGPIAQGCWGRRGARAWSLWRRRRLHRGCRGSISRCCILSGNRSGRTPPCWLRCALTFCRRWRGPIEAWILDDTSFPKKGRHSVGVTRQYCGQLGKRANCQAAVTLSLANHQASLPIGYRLYLPQEWAEDAPRRKQAGVPDAIAFETKPAIALGLIDEALSQGVPRGFVLADAGYGSDTAFRQAVTALGLPYAMGVGPATSVWPPGVRPLAQVKPWSGKGPRPLLRLRRDEDRKPVSVKELALSLPDEAFEVIAWREGSNDGLKGRFARVRVHAAHRDNLRSELRPEEWLVIEWPETEAEPTKYWLSTLPPDIAFGALVDAIKLRWRIERDYLELKQEVGLGHYEGRGWRGFHHHATLCIAAYGFLIAERETIPPSGHPGPRQFQPSPVSPRPRPRRSAPQTRAPRPKLNRNPATTIGRRLRTHPPQMSLLPQIPTQRILMTQ